MNIVATTWCVWIKIRRSASIYQTRAQRQTRCNAKGYLQTYGNRSMMLGIPLLASLNRLIGCQEIFFSIYASSRWIRDDSRHRFCHRSIAKIIIASRRIRINPSQTWRQVFGIELHRPARNLFIFFKMIRLRSIRFRMMIGRAG